MVCMFIFWFLIIGSHLWLSVLWIKTYAERFIKLPRVRNMDTSNLNWSALFIHSVKPNSQVRRICMAVACAFAYGTYVGKDAWLSEICVFFSAQRPLLQRLSRRRHGNSPPLFSHVNLCLLTSWPLSSRSYLSCLTIPCAPRHWEHMRFLWDRSRNVPIADQSYCLWEESTLYSGN